MQSKATTVKEYLKEIPAERKAVIEAIRNAILTNIPSGFEEVMNYGMIGYVVPHKLYPDGYHCDPKVPLPFLNVASQKNHISIYHMGLYEGELLDWFKEEWKKVSDKKLDMGKCCIRFKKPEDVPVQLIGKLAKKLTVKKWIELYESNLKNSKK